ncbi:hypothetical protein [Glaciecola sp. 1036]|uniref:hypothetical protein n=1 Tax=Alteromonadaceae TaxID=72275 RepID=UPI003CFF4C39
MTIFTLYVATTLIFSASAFALETYLEEYKGQDYSSSQSNESSSNLTARCQVASEYFRNQSSQSKIENIVESLVIERLKNKKTLTEENSILLNDYGFQLEQSREPSGVGFNLISNDKGHPIVAIIGRGDTKLVFDLELKENMLDSGNTYLVNLFLDRNASKIQGIRIDNAMPNGIVNDVSNTTPEDNLCLREILKKVADEAPWGRYIGEGLSDSNFLTNQADDGFNDYCIRSVSSRTCSNAKQGQTCTNTLYHFPERCL